MTDELETAPPKRQRGRPRKKAQLRPRKIAPTTPIDGVITGAAGKHGPQPFQKQIDYTQAEQVEYIALQLIAHRMNYRLAFRDLFPNVGLEELTRHVSLAKASKELKQELAAQFESVGLGGEAKAAFLNELYSWFFGDDKLLKTTAAKLLGRGFIGERVTVEKPETLRFTGLEKGLERMKLFDGEEESNEVEDQDNGTVPTAIQ